MVQITPMSQERCETSPRSITPKESTIDALPLYQRALAILEKVLGADHPDAGRALNDLAALYQAQGKYDACRGALLSARWPSLRRRPARITPM